MFASPSVFTGENALFDFLNPKTGMMAPMVELPAHLNPYAATHNIRIHAKLLNMMPLGNVKSIPAFHMLDKADKKDAEYLVENSSGNTVASMGILAPYFGFKDVHAYVSNEVTKGKLQLLQLCNVTPIVNQEPICPSEHDTESGIHKARIQGRDPEWFNPDQYANPDNIDAHYTITGPQLWQQRGGAIDYFCAGMGTTGTLIGSARYLKEQHPDLQVVGIVRAPNNPVPGPRTKNLLKDISFNWQEICDHLIECNTHESFATSLNMMRAGLFAGPSSGMALAGTLHFIQQMIDDGHFTIGQREINIVFPCCDQPYPYMDDYFAMLPASYFPPIHNAELLSIATPDMINSSAADLSQQHETSEIEAEILFEKLQQADTHPITLIDIRSKQDFDHFHIEQAINMPRDEFIAALPTWHADHPDQDMYVICYMGRSSLDACAKARSHGIQAISVKGGMMTWSEKNFPRIRHENCVLKYDLEPLN